MTARLQRIDPGWLILVLSAVALSGCSDPQPGTPHPPAGVSSEPDVPHTSPADRREASVSNAVSSIRFEDGTDRSGVDFTYRNGEEAGHYAILESLGGGVGMIDFDLDGAVDLFFPGGGEFDDPPAVRGRLPALYRNREALQFQEVTRFAHANVGRYYSHGAAVGDYDSDGFRDILVTGYGGLLLFHNLGDGTFEELAAAAGLEVTWGSSAGWADFDGNGDLDLYVVQYVNWSFDNHPRCNGPNPGEIEVCPPRQFDGLPDLVYFSNGDGTFRPAPLEPGKGLGVVLADFDLDRDVDVYVGNDTVLNFLYVNEGQGRFHEWGLISGAGASDRGVPDGSMGVDVGDFNLDGRPDLWAANYEQESFALYRGQERCFFQHVSQLMGVSAVRGLYVGWGTAFADLDCDGDEDVFVSNGHVIRHPENAPLRQQPLLFQNDAGRRFVNIASESGDYLRASHMGRGLAVGDLDNDGDLDLGISHTNEPVSLLVNVSANNHHWINLRLVGRTSHRDAVGAIVHVTTPDGRTQLRLSKSGASYASSHDRRIHVGLGDCSQIEEVRILWPSGRTQVLADVPVDTFQIIVEPLKEGLSQELRWPEAEAG